MGFEIFAYSLPSPAVVPAASTCSLVHIVCVLYHPPVVFCAVIVCASWPQSVI